MNRLEFLKYYSASSRHFQQGKEKALVRAFYVVVKSSSSTVNLLKPRCEVCGDQSSICRPGSHTYTQCAAEHAATLATLPDSALYSCKSCDKPLKLWPVDLLPTTRCSGDSRAGHYSTFLLFFIRFLNFWYFGKANLSPNSVL